MEFKLQALGPFLHWLTLGILCVMPIVLAYAVFRLGELPGAIARFRNHPQADAIRVCGWLGIITLILWPIAMVWAYYKTPAQSAGGSLAGDVDAKTAISSLQLAQKRLAELQLRLS